MAGASTCRRGAERERGVTAPELRDYLRDKIVRGWLPERWTFIDEMPKTRVGKFDKKLIRSRYAADAYDVIECTD